MSALGTWRDKLFPDLARCGDEETAWRALTWAILDLRKTPAGAVVVVVFAVLLFYSLLMGGLALAIAFTCVYGLLAACVLPLLLRRSVTHLLWRQLRREGFVCCQRCGYDLRASAGRRCPECGMDDVQAIADVLVERERSHRRGSRAMVVFGFPVSLLGPVVIATMFWLAFVFWWGSDRPDTNVSWIGLFVWMTIVCLPLLYHLEMRTRGRYLASVLDETDVSAQRGAMFRYGMGRELFAMGAIAANRRATSSLFVEWFLVGPRLVLGGLRRLKLARAVGGVDRSSVARITRSLLKRDSGIAVADLEDQHADLVPLLAYLTFHGWTGIGGSWERVWLYSESRQELAEHVSVPRVD